MPGNARRHLGPQLVDMCPESCHQFPEVALPLLASINFFCHGNETYCYSLLPTTFYLLPVNTTIIATTATTSTSTTTTTTIIIAATAATIAPVWQFTCNQHGCMIPSQGSAERGRLTPVSSLLVDPARGRPNHCIHTAAAALLTDAGPRRSLSKNHLSS